MRPGVCDYREDFCVTAKKRDVVRGNNKWKGSVASLSGLSGLLVSFLSIFVVVCTRGAILE